MLYESLSLKTANKLRDYELLKKYLKKEIEKESYISIERLTKFLEILEEKEKDNEQSINFRKINK